MADYLRFSADFLDNLRMQTNLVALIEQDGIALKRSGKSLVGLCPFHEESTPSFHVSPGHNTYRCFGCGTYGDAIEWMRQRRHLSFHDAVVHLAQQCGIPMPTPENREQTRQSRKHLAAVYQILKDVARIYARGLDKSPAASKYLFEQRGLTAKTVRTFGLGVVAKGIVALLVEKHRDALLAAGLAVAREDGSVYDHFRHRIMIPIHNERGYLVGFAGRALADRTSAPKYINSPETELFSKRRELYALHLAKSAIRETGVAVVVEGYFDVISLHQAGEQRAVAPMGTALTNTQIQRLLAHADTIVFAFDADAAGRKAALSAALVLLAELHDGKTARFLFLPEGDDPDSFVRKHGLDAWRAALEQATPLSAFLAEHVSHGLDKTMPESQVAAARKALEILGHVQHAPLFARALQARFEELIGIALQENSNTDK